MATGYADGYNQDGDRRTMMHQHIAGKVYDIELLTPKQSSEKLEEDLDRFATKYQTILDAGHMVCITDNPMGLLSFQGTEMIEELGLPVKPDQVSIHLNTFHTKPDLDGILRTCIDMGISNLLIISGDGSERLPRLAGADVGYEVEAVTSVELLRYIHREYPDAFETGVAYNPYEPQEHEMAKMRRKIDAGASFVITQPILGQHDELDLFLKTFDLPVVVEAWMMKKLHLLSECVGYEIPEGTVHDPIESLQTLITNYPVCGFYLSFLGFKTQLPVIGDLWR